MIEFQNVTKFYGEQDVLVDASFTINPGERVGIVGPNGTGKSTLFGMILGEVQSDRGHVIVPKKTRLGHLRQELLADVGTVNLLKFTADAIDDLNVIQANIDRLDHELKNAKGADADRILKRIGTLQTEFEHLGGYELESRAEAALSGLGFSEADFSKPFKQFSGGWQMRAELARTLIAHPDILLLDEPSNYLDLPAVEWLQRYLRDFQGTLVLISHDRYLLESLTGITLEVIGGRITRFAGNYAYYLREREGRLTQQLAAKKNQDRKRAEIERFVERFRAKNTKATQVQSRIKMLEKMEDIQVPATAPELSLIQIPDPPHCGSTVIEVEQLGKTYDNQEWILRKVDLTLQREDKIALVGFNGTGKTTLLRMIAGVLEASEGKRRLGHKVIVGYQSQEFAETMPPEKTAYDIVRGGKGDSTDKEIRTILGIFGFSGDAVEKPCKVLSGGEKIRLAFARIFINPPNLLVLDEPTTHLDISGRRALEQAVTQYTGAVVLVSHDVTFVSRTANRIVAMTKPGISMYHGDYNYYREKIDGIEPASPATNVKANKGSSSKEARRERAQQREALKKKTRQLEKEITQTEKLIEDFEAEQEKLLEQLSSEQQGINFAELNQRLTTIQQELTRRNARWEDLSIELEKITNHAD